MGVGVKGLSLSCVAQRLLNNLGFWCFMKFDVCQVNLSILPLKTSERKWFTESSPEITQGLFVILGHDVLQSLEFVNIIIV